MASINFDDYEKNRLNSEAPPVENEKENDGEYVHCTVGMLDVKNTQFLVKEENVLFDFVELQFGDKDNGEPNIGVEVWISYLGDDFKMKCEMMSKEDYDELEIGDYIGYLMSEYYPCLQCKTEFLDGLCRDHHHEEENDEEDSEDES